MKLEIYDFIIIECSGGGGAAAAGCRRFLAAQEEIPQVGPQENLIFPLNRQESAEQYLLMELIAYQTGLVGSDIFVVVVILIKLILNPLYLTIDRHLLLITFILDIFNI